MNNTPNHRAVPRLILVLLISSSLLAVPSARGAEKCRASWWRMQFTLRTAAIITFVLGAGLASYYYDDKLRKQPARRAALRAQIQDRDQYKKEVLALPEKERNVALLKMFFALVGAPEDIGYHKAIAINSLLPLASTDTQKAMLRVQATYDPEAFEYVNWKDLLSQEAAIKGNSLEIEERAKETSLLLTESAVKSSPKEQLSEHAFEFLNGVRQIPESMWDTKAYDEIRKIEARVLKATVSDDWDKWDQDTLLLVAALAPKPEEALARSLVLWRDKKIVGMHRPASVRNEKIIELADETRRRAGMPPLDTANLREEILHTEPYDPDRKEDRLKYLFAITVEQGKRISSNDWTLMRSLPESDDWFFGKYAGNLQLVTRNDRELWLDYATKMILNVEHRAQATLESADPKYLDGCFEWIEPLFENPDIEWKLGRERGTLNKLQSIILGITTNRDLNRIMRPEQRGRVKAISRKLEDSREAVSPSDSNTELFLITKQ